MTELFVHIHAPPAESVRLRRLDCPTCQKRRYFVIAAYEWYGPDLWCLWCGERFNEEGRAVRPFARGWRAKSKEDARRMYRRYYPKGEQAVEVVEG